MSTQFSHDPHNHCYTLTLDDEPVGRADYRLGDDAIVFTHTEIDEDRREKGLASQLVQFALDDVRDTTSLRVVAQCPFVAHWIDEHPDYQQLQTR